MMKKLGAFFCAIIVAVSVIGGSVLAVEPGQTVVDLGDGFYMVETMDQGPMVCSENEVAGSKSANIYYKSTLVGIATLYGVFDISGTTARATAATIRGTGKNGGVYVKGTTNGSGNTVTGTATFEIEGVEKRLTLSISCSPSGELSCADTFGLFPVQRKEALFMFKKRPRIVPVLPKSFNFTQDEISERSGKPLQKR